MRTCRWTWRTHRLSFWPSPWGTAASSPPMNATSAPIAGNPAGHSKTCLPDELRREAAPGSDRFVNLLKNKIESAFEEVLLAHRLRLESRQIGIAEGKD